MKYHIACWMAVCMFALATANAQKKPGKYLKGYYIDSTGNKTEGFISLEEMTLESFDFKKQLGDKKEKITVARCQAFAFDQHSFCTLTDVTIRTRVWHYHFNRVFAEQVAEGPLQLFRLYFKPGKVGYMRYISIAGKFAPGPAGIGVGVFMNSKYVNYFLKKGDDTTGYRFIGKNRKAFMASLAPFLKDNAQLMEKIKSGGDYSFNNVESVVREYNNDINNKQ